MIYPGEGKKGQPNAGDYVLAAEQTRAEAAAGPHRSRRFVSKDSDQTETPPRKFKLGPLGNLNQVTKGLAKTIRAMADGTLDSQVGARICNGLGIMRACFETQKLEQLEERMEKIIDHVPYTRIKTEETELYVPSGANGHDHAEATRMISTDETERHSN